MAAHQNATFMKELTKKLVWNPACQIADKGLGLRKPRLIRGSHESVGTVKNSMKNPERRGQ
jgi:hypothetical protein